MSAKTNILITLTCMMVVAPVQATVHQGTQDKTAISSSEESSLHPPCKGEFDDLVETLLVEGWTSEPIRQKLLNLKDCALEQTAPRLCLATEGWVDPVTFAMDAVFAAAIGKRIIAPVQAAVDRLTGVQILPMTLVAVNHCNDGDLLPDPVGFTWDLSSGDMDFEVFEQWYFTPGP